MIGAVTCTKVLRCKGYEIGDGLLCQLYCLVSNIPYVHVVLLMEADGE